MPLAQQDGAFLHLTSALIASSSVRTISASVYRELGRGIRGRASSSCNLSAFTDDRRASARTSSRPPVKAAIRGRRPRQLSVHGVPARPAWRIKQLQPASRGFGFVGRLVGRGPPWRNPRSLHAGRSSPSTGSPSRDCQVQRANEHAAQKPAQVVIVEQATGVTKARQRSTTRTGRAATPPPKPWTKARSRRRGAEQQRQLVHVVPHEGSTSRAAGGSREPSAWPDVRPRGSWLWVNAVGMPGPRPALTTAGGPGRGAAPAQLDAVEQDRPPLIPPERSWTGRPGRQRLVGLEHLLASAKHCLRAAAARHRRTEALRQDARAPGPRVRRPADGARRWFPWDSRPTGQFVSVFA